MITQNKILIRETVIEDRTSLCQLMTQFGYTITESDMGERIQLYDAHPLNRAWIAEQNKITLGCIAVDVVEPFHSKQKICRIITLIIDEQHRGKKIGKLLVSKAETYAKKIECSSIEVTTDWQQAKNGAQDFYKNLNYSELKLYLAKESIKSGENVTRIV